MTLESHYWDENLFSGIKDVIHDIWKNFLTLISHLWPSLVTYKSHFSDWNLTCHIEISPVTLKCHLWHWNLTCGNEISLVALKSHLWHWNLICNLICKVNISLVQYYFFTYNASAYCSCFGRFEFFRSWDFSKFKNSFNFLTSLSDFRGRFCIFYKWIGTCQVYIEREW